MIPNYAQTAEFSASTDSSCAPVTIQFTNLSTGSPSAIKWDFGDGRTTFENNPVISYNTPGTYIVTLTAFYNNVTNYATKTVHIFGAPASNFTADNLYSCQTPFTVTFTDNTPGISSRTWDFGDNTQLTTTTTSATHTYTYEGSFNVTLMNTSNYGCSSTIIKNDFINIKDLSVDLFRDKSSGGCIPLAVNFNAFIKDIINEPIISYMWDFGDGITSNEASPQHVYISDGIYDVKLKINTQSGCSYEADTKGFIKAGSQPSADFTFIPNTPACADPGLSFAGSTMNTDTWYWDFGDGITQLDTINKTIHKFKKTGQLPVQLITYNKGCPSIPVQKNVTINGPVARFSFQPKNCSLQDTILFTDQSLQAVSLKWNFGDILPDDNFSDQLSPTHIYSKAGKYNVILTASNNNGCSDTVMQSLYVINTSPELNVSNHKVCEGFSVTLSSKDSIIFKNFSWHFGDNTPAISNTGTSTVNKVYDIPGNYVDSLIVTDINGCTYLTPDPTPINVVKPTAKFSLPAKICFDLPALFQDNSIPYNNAFPIVKWNWSFGDGDTSSVQNPLKTYNISSGNAEYSVMLHVTDNNGCSDTSYQSLNVNPSPILFIPIDSFAICRGNSIRLNAVSDNIVTWIPNYNLSCDHCLSPVVTPQSDTNYIVGTTNSFGCTKQDTAFVRVSQPFNISINPKNISICSGDSIQLSVNGGASKYIWQRNASLSCSNCDNPIAKPVSSTTYYVIGHNNDTCYSAIDSAKVIVLPPPPIAVVRNEDITVGSSAQLNATSNENVISWKWSPSDYLSCNNCSNPVSTPKDSITYYVKATDTNGCTNSDYVKINLICSGGVVFVPNTFTPNGDGINDVFYPRGKGVKIIHYFRVFNRWGKIVYSRNNFNINDKSNGWDGSFQGQALPPDVYVYEAEMVCDNNGVFHVKGNITLLR